MYTFNSEVSEEETIKKSRFIAIGCHIDSEEEFNEWLKSLKAKYNDARHIAYAFRYTQNKQTFQKSSDDGEPSGTAGKPILNIIINDELMNVGVAVVRYFGGIKLGASGLIRAYGGTAKLLRPHYVDILEQVNITCSISNADKLIRYLDNKALTYSKQFGKDLTVKVYVKDKIILDDLPNFCNIQ